jgi:excisionase family DNA binding protein
MENIIQINKMNPTDLGVLIKSVLREELKPLLLHIKTKSSSDDEFLTRKEAAEFLKISNTTLYTLDKTQVLPAKRLRGKVLYLKSDLLSFDK